jgi:hypothetical protein
VKVIRALSRRGILLGTAESAALPAVHAATSPDAKGGHFYGPDGFLHLGGVPAEQALYARLRTPRTSSGPGEPVIPTTDHRFASDLPPGSGPATGNPG